MVHQWGSGSFLACKRDTWINMCGMEEGNSMIKHQSSDSSDLLSAVCNATGRSKYFYRDWDDNCLRQRLESYKEESENKTHQTHQTLQEKQRDQRSAFLNKMFPELK